MLTAVPLDGLPEITAGTDLGELISKLLDQAPPPAAKQPVASGPRADQAALACDSRTNDPSNNGPA